MSFIIESIICILLLLFAWIRVMEVFFEKRKTSLVILILSCLPFLISSIIFSSSFPIHPIPRLLFQQFSFFIITLNYKSYMIKRLAAVGSTFILFNVIYNFFGLFSIIFPNLIGDNWLFSIIYLLTIILVFFLTEKLLKRYIKANKNAIDIPAIWIPTLIISGSAVFLGILYLAKVPHIEEIWIVLMWFGALFLILYLSNTLSTVFEDRLKSALHAREKDYYFTQCKLMQESVERVKSIRHDIKTHLATLKDYTSENKAATDYLNSLLEDIGESEIYSDTGNIAFDSIINYKLRDAKKDSVKLDLRLLVPTAMNVEVADIATILGNLLDNALEAVAMVNNKKIKLDIEFGKGGLFIKVDNTFNGEIKCFEAGEVKQIASLKNSDEHGYGLMNIRKALEKYNGHMKITYMEDVFSVGVFLYVDAV